MDLYSILAGHYVAEDVTEGLVESLWYLPFLIAPLLIRIKSNKYFAKIAWTYFVISLFISINSTCYAYSTYWAMFALGMSHIFYAFGFYSRKKKSSIVPAIIFLLMGINCINTYSFVFGRYVDATDGTMQTRAEFRAKLDRSQGNTSQNDYIDTFPISEITESDKN